MKHLLEHWDRISERIAESRLVLFLDFDGTLAPIAESPERAVMPEANRELLRLLAAGSGCTVAVVSGRTVDDVRSKVGLEGPIYVGSHGAEILWPDGTLESAGSATFRAQLEKLKRVLIAELAGTPGALLEDKQTCLAVHYRTVAEQDVAGVRATVREALQALPENEHIRIAEGKMVLELRHSAGPDKGSAVLKLLAREEERLRGVPLCPIYVGDDLTDEDAFEALKNAGLTVFVGLRGRSTAEYHLSSTEEVSTLLRMLAEHFAAVK
ncbi:MAG: trehalose-phosphatase [Candidatus Eisenbacteria bacterium]|nr:trehalose-phosphatase [Candidatus Eisenbacteria bacterium]